MDKISYIVYIKNHKNSKGEKAPWVIKSHETGEIISSHKTKAEALKHLKRMKYFKNKKALLGDFDAGVNPNIFDIQALRKSIIAEYDAINLYEQLAEKVSPELKQFFLDIAKEEKVHVGEFETLLKELDCEFEPSLDEGENEIYGQANNITIEASEKFKFDPNSTENEGRFRIRDPKDFLPNSFRRWKEWAGVEAPDGVSFIVGTLKKTKNKALQSIRFDKSKWDEESAADFWDSIKDQHGFEKYWEWDKKSTVLSIYCPFAKISNKLNESIDIIVLDDIPYQFKYEDTGKYVLVDLNKFNDIKELATEKDKINKFANFLNENLGQRFLGFKAKAYKIEDILNISELINKYPIFFDVQANFNNEELIDALIKTGNSIIKKDLKNDINNPGNIDYVEFNIKDKQDVQNLKEYIENIEKEEPKRKIINIEYRGMDKDIIKELMDIMNSYKGLNENWYDFKRDFGPNQPFESPTNTTMPGNQFIEDMSPYISNTPSEFYQEEYISTLYPNRTDYNMGGTDWAKRVYEGKDETEGGKSGDEIS